MAAVHIILSARPDVYGPVKCDGKSKRACSGAGHQEIEPPSEQEHAGLQHKSDAKRCRAKSYITRDYIISKYIISKIFCVTTKNPAFNAGTGHF